MYLDCSFSSPDPGDTRVRLAVGGDVQVKLFEGLRGADAIIVLGEEPRFHDGVHLIVLTQQSSSIQYSNIVSCRKSVTHVKCRKRLCRHTRAVA